MIYTLEDYSNENMIRPLQWNRGNVVRMLIFIVIIYVCIISSISIFLYCDQNDELISEYQDRLARISTEMKYIQRQHDYLLMEIQKKMGVDVMHAMMDPSLEYEITRRRIYENTQELWYFINEQFQKVMITEHKTELAETNIDMKIQILKDIADIKRSLLSDQEELVALDGFANWRREEAEAVSSLIQRRLDSIQNPQNCSLNKKVVCSLDKKCGYGCQIHQIVFCMIYAYATERTLLLDPSKPKRIKMWQNVLMPLSKCSLSQDTFMEMLDQKKVSMNLKSKHVDTIYLTNMDDLRNIPKFLITAIPEDLVNRIIRFNGDPYSWWVGQFVKFIFKPTKYFHKNIQSKLAELDFKNPIVGIHIRGLEKMKSKTMNDTINYYMYHVEDYYDQLAMTTNIGKRRVFVATDDLKVYKIIVNRYLNYTFISNVAKHTEKQTLSSVISFVTDVSMLALCNYVVGSFNSNLGRLAYEMMQSSRDAAKSFQSLDDVYFLKKQDAYMREAIYRHTAQNGDEFDFEEKDQIGVVELALGKYAIGVHDKTRKSGAFPLYKTSKILETYPFPKYKKVPLYKETRTSINSL